MQPPVHWLLGTLCSGVKRHGREANYSPNKKEWTHTTTGQLCNFTLHQARTRSFCWVGGADPEAPCNLCLILKIRRIGSQV